MTAPVKGKRNAPKAAPAISDADGDDDQVRVDTNEQSVVEDAQTNANDNLCIEDESNLASNTEALDGDSASLEVSPDVLFIYRPECLDCLHLTENGSRAYKKCYLDEGNTDCPAGSIRIVVGVPMERVVTAIITATLEANAEKLAILYGKLQERDPVVVQRVMDEVRQRMSRN